MGYVACSCSHKCHSVQVSNVKVRWRVPQDVPLAHKTAEADVVLHSNFFTKRLGHYVFTVFYKNNHVNASGIRDFADIKGAVQTFNAHFACHVHERNIIVDNSTASGQLPHCVSLDPLVSRAQSAHVSISIRPHVFPAAVIRQRVADRSSAKNGTIILFSNRKFVVVGCKTFAGIGATVSQLCALTCPPSRT